MDDVSSPLLNNLFSLFFYKLLAFYSALFDNFYRDYLESSLFAVWLDLIDLNHNADHRANIKEGINITFQITKLVRRLKVLIVLCVLRLK